MSRVCGLATLRTPVGRARRVNYSIVNDQVSDVNYQESLGDSETARPMCSSDGTEFSPLKVPELMQTYCPSMHAVLTVQWGC